MIVAQCPVCKIGNGGEGCRYCKTGKFAPSSVGGVLESLVRENIALRTRLSQQEPTPGRTTWEGKPGFIPIPAPTAADLALDLGRVYRQVADTADSHMYVGVSLVCGLVRRLAALEAEVACLRRQIEGHVERIAGQGEVLTRAAERRGA